jgi:hypothetical protein
MKDLAGLTVSPEEFELLAAYCGADGVFPRTWERWTELMSMANAAAAAANLQYGPLQVNPPRFKEWCARLEIVPCLDALRAYSISHRAEPGASHYGTLGLDSRPGTLSV